MKVKVKVQMIIKDHLNRSFPGRECWINRTEENNLVFGSIYLDEESAPYLTKEEFEFVKSRENPSTYKIIKFG